MSHIIASMYEVIGKIGSGGGGIVYLAQHIRLNKMVVLKADKRKLSASDALLRKEVDTLKNLSHTYIPQVYDYFIEDGTVYTVMDFIEGESLDKPLKRGDRFSQPQVIRWALQLLDALCYLHARPPYGILHSDIKPANIMLTPEGDIRLIDFNIALMLGEDGAIAVGRSFGYASPEHYAASSSAISATSPSGNADAPLAATEVLSNRKTALLSGTPRSGSGGTKLLDVRSDLYSLGATLYHLLSGSRPTRDATDVIPLPESELSPSLARIISKLMNADPSQRYQSAHDALWDFEHLRENDPRIKRHKRTAIMTAFICTAIFLAGGFTAFIGLRQMEQLQKAYALAEYAQNALLQGNVTEAIEYALQSLPKEDNFFSPRLVAESQKALADALGVYDLSDGFKAYKTIALPSAPLRVALSPDGKTGAALYAYDILIFSVETTEILATLPAAPSALADMEFAGDCFVYAGEDAVKVYDIVTRGLLWSGKPATEIAVSGDGNIVAAVYISSDSVTLYDIRSGKETAVVSLNSKQHIATDNPFANPGGNLFTLNHDGSLLAVSCTDGSLNVYDIFDPENSLELFDKSDFTRFEGGFSEKYFAFSASGGDSCIFAVIDTVEKEQTGGFQSARPFNVQADRSGVYVSTDNILVRIDPETGEQQELAYTGTDIAAFARDDEHTIVSMADGSYAFFDARANMMQKYTLSNRCDYVEIAGRYAVVGSLDSPTLRILHLEDHEEAQIFSYDPAYTHDEARLSPNGRTVMLYSYDRFRLFLIDGTLIRDTEIPNAENVYDQQVRRSAEGAWLEITYKDGLVYNYSFDTGELMSETKGEMPDSSLDEEFFTDHLRISAPLHGTPVAYDQKTGKLISLLEKDSYLTYVTQVRDNIITEYIAADGSRYGLLLNNQCEILARLPELCDIVGEELIFDDRAKGVLRKSRIYSMEDLVAFSHTKGI